jgi:hypothetical protein
MAGIAYKCSPDKEDEYSMCRMSGSTMICCGCVAWLRERYVPHSRDIHYANAYDIYYANMSPSLRVLWLFLSKVPTCIRYTNLPCYMTTLYVMDHKEMFTIKTTASSTLYTILIRNGSCVGIEHFINNYNYTAISLSFSYKNIYLSTQFIKYELICINNWIVSELFTIFYRIH